jgi:protease-4
MVEMTFRPAMFALMFVGLLSTGFPLPPLAAQEAKTAEKPAAKAADKPAKVEEVVYAHIELAGAYPEGATPPGIFGEITENLAAITGRIEKVATDPKVAGLILELGDVSLGWGKIDSLVASIKKVRAAGKKVHCYLEGADNKGYLVAAACDEIVMPESGLLMLVGLRAEVTFYKNLFDKIGVKADMLRVGEFKSAAEPYTRTEMSKEFREEMEAVIDDYYDLIVGRIAEGRGIAPDAVKKLLDEGPQSATAALAGKLVDRLAYEDEIEASLKAIHPGKKLVVQHKFGKKKLDTDFSGFGGMVKMMELVMGVEPPKRKSTAAKVAVIHADGPIMSGPSQSDLFGESTMGSDTMIKAFRDAAKDDTVKAVVLRINSPGGSALASDLMWRELKRLGKPFVVSMGDVAASGGYYIAMGSDRIFAEPGTLTGSIGVVGGKLSLGGLYDKIGMTTSVITRGKNAGIFSTTTAFSDSERETMQKMLNEIYKQFTEKAAAGRKMDVAVLEKLARGRVYTGRQALKIGLVDELGTLDDAVKKAVEMAGLKPEDKIERLHLPKAVSPFEALLGPIDAEARVATGVRERGLVELVRLVAPEAARKLDALRTLEVLAKERAALALPYSIEIK